MKKIILTIMLLIVSYFLNAQIVNIPDANFKYVLVNWDVADLGNGIYEDVDTNNDGEIQVSEAEVVLELFLLNSGISSLEGIQSFSIIRKINLESNQLTSLDFTQNPLLEYIDCNHNQLTSLNVTGNSNLVYLDCKSNFIESLIIGQNINLIELWAGGNNLNELDVSLITNLEILSFYGNKTSEISEIDVSQNVNLKMLSFQGLNFSSIDVSQNINLEILFCSFNNFNEINVSQNPNLKWLDISNNLLTSLDVSQNPNLEWLYCMNNFLQNLNINNENNTILEIMFANDNSNLGCIQVDDESYSNNQTCQTSIGWCKDETASYSEECILNIVDFDNSKIINLYPNPSNGIINISNGSDFKIASIKLFDLIGKMVLSYDDNLNQINLSKLENGIYLMKIEVNNKVITKKIIKK